MEENWRSPTRVGSVRELNVYQLAFQSAMEIFELSKTFPKEEKYSLTDQIRRSSRSVCSNLAEGWRKRKYEAVFVNKLTDCQAEAAETQIWLDFLLACGYISKDIFSKINQQYEQIYAKLKTMERKSDLFCSS